MQPRSLKHLTDILDASRFILQSTLTASGEQYDVDRLLRNAVERNFEIIGEALNRLRREDPDVVRHIGDFERIIAFRNLLAHGYDMLDHKQVWKVIQHDLPRLVTDVEALLPG